MNNGVPFYAIRIKGTNFYKCNRHLYFGTFEDAVGNGVFFNQKKNAEKVIRDCLQQLRGHKNYPIHSSRFTIYESGWSNPKDYSGIQEFVDEASKEYPIEFMEIDLETVELTLKVAEQPDA